MDLHPHKTSCDGCASTNKIAIQRVINLQYINAFLNPHRYSFQFSKYVLSITFEKHFEIQYPFWNNSLAYGSHIPFKRSKFKRKVYSTDSPAFSVIARSSNYN